LSLWHVDFQELYARHLGRHSQFGINVNHLIALYGLWFGVYATIYQIILALNVPRGWLAIVGLAVAYLVVVAINSPSAVTLVTALFMTVFVTSVLALPRLPIGAIVIFLVMIPLFYKVQAWGHKIWTSAADMTDFNRRFPPGRALNIILLFYEVPICLNYLVFGTKDWRR
jgi:hypothetical protein